jgi:hypothetical protein
MHTDPRRGRDFHEAAAVEELTTIRIEKIIRRYCFQRARQYFAFSAR